LVENKEVPDFNIGVPLVHTVSAQNRRTLHLQIVRLFCIASILHSFAISTNFKFVFQSVRLNPARVVFDIKLENGAQKVVTVKSALVLKNKTDFPVEVKLELPKGIVLATTLTIVLITPHMINDSLFRYIIAAKMAELYVNLHDIKVNYSDMLILHVISNN
jgi:hypothetical protein